MDCMLPDGLSEALAANASKSPLLDTVHETDIETLGNAAGGGVQARLRAGPLALTKLWAETARPNFSTLPPLTLSTTSEVVVADTCCTFCRGSVEEASIAPSARLYRLNAIGVKRLNDPVTCRRHVVVARN